MAAEIQYKETTRLAYWSWRVVFVALCVFLVFVLKDNLDTRRKMTANRETMNAALDVKLLRLYFDEESPEGEFVVELLVTNTGGPGVTEFEGLLTLLDQNGKVIQRLGIENDSPVPEGVAGTLEFAWERALFSSEDRELSEMDFSEITGEYSPERLVFSDGRVVTLESEIE